MSATSTKPQRQLSGDYLPFLDYPHSHDPTRISDIVALSIELLRQLPEEVQDSLWRLQESTSVLYASYGRLQDLLAEKFDRLSLSADSESYSEVVFFNYVNQCTAERAYFFDDALPEWKHKLRDVKLEEYLHLTFKFKAKETTVRDWFTNLQDKVTEWAQQVRSVEVPDFGDTLSEYTSSSTTPTTLASVSSTNLTHETSRPLSMSESAISHEK